MLETIAAPPARRPQTGLTWGALFSHSPSGPVPAGTAHAEVHAHEPCVDERGSHAQALSWAMSVARAQPGIEFELMYRDRAGTWRSRSGECSAQVAARRWERG